MTEGLALHTAARRYCGERAALWRTRYGEMAPHCVSGKYSDAEKDVFSRHVLLDGVLAEVEGLHPETLMSTKEAREVLLLAGQIAEGAYTAPPGGSTGAEAMRQERDLFCAYIAGLDGDALARITPMASRRTLLSRESKEIWAGMRRRWGVTHATWHRPQGEAPLGAIVFGANAFEEHIPAPVFQDILSEHGIGRAFEMREWGPEYEIDVSLLVPSYDAAQMPSYRGAQGYWTADDLDWLVHASDEASVTVAGGWLVRAVEKRWPTWSEYPVRY